MQTPISDLNERYSELPCYSSQGVAKLALLGRITREVSQRGLDYPGISKGEGQPFATLVFANDAQACGQWTETYRNLIMQPLSKFEQAANQLARSVELIHPHTGAGNTFGIISPPTVSVTVSLP
jgi:hypothetical protein